MLSSLNIQNIALIEKLNVNLSNGLNILSGETGAGKSIIIDAVGFVLGDRADKSLIRYGTDFATVEGVFEDYQTDKISTYLDDIGIEPEEILILRRKMTVDGKNECRINGKQVTLSILRGLTELLVDLHGQHEHQSLLNPNTHIDLLDELDLKIRPIKEEYKTAYDNFHTLKREFNSLGDATERERKLDILSYQIAEIEKADIKEGEEQELLDKRSRVRNLEKILNALNSSNNLLDGYDNTAVTSEIETASNLLDRITSFDNRVSDLVDRLQSAKTEIADIAETLKSMVQELDFDSRSADELEERLDTVRNLQRKYGGSYDVLQTFYKNASDEYNMLSNATERVNKLESEIKKASKNLITCAQNLTSQRQRIADKFEKSILKELNDLGMGGSTFKVQIDTEKDENAYSSNGADTIEFLISPNKGEPLKPLAKIISGGEMSRFMLALKNILAEIDGIGTMIFDEIDTGISGNISAVVSEKMCNISRNRQVIAVTHMPSLASMADEHFLIEKYVENDKTITRLTHLADDTDEIARLIGGKDYSVHAIPHAKEMKAWAERYKQSIKK